MDHRDRLQGRLDPRWRGRSSLWTSVILCGETGPYEDPCADVYVVRLANSWIRATNSTATQDSPATSPVHTPVSPQPYP